MTREQEIKMAHATKALEETGAVFVVLYGFPGDADCYVEGRGDGREDHREKFTRALWNHWHGDKTVHDVYGDSGEVA